MLNSMGSRRRCGRFAVIFLTALLAPQNGWPAESGEELGNPRAGMSLFVSKGCIRCHSIWERGDKVGPSLAAVGARRNLYELCASIWSHWAQMNAALQKDKIAPIVLSEAEIRDIVAYLSYLNYYREPGNTDQGAKLFRDRGCLQCHAIEPTATDSAKSPPVYRMKTFQGPINLAVALWNHGGEMLRTMAGKGLPWPQIQDQEVAHLVQYIRSQNGESPALSSRLPGNPAKGREVFVAKTCVDCHQTNGGSSRSGPHLAKSGSRASLSTIVAHLWNHYPRMAQAMAAKGITPSRMTNTEMEDLIAYLYWIRAYGIQGNPVSGQQIYTTKQCASCHPAKPEANNPIPALIGSRTTGSPYTMLAAIWNHGPRMQNLLKERNISWPAVTGEEMRDLVAFFQADRQRTTK